MSNKDPNFPQAPDLGAAHKQARSAAGEKPAAAPAEPKATEYDKPEPALKPGGSFFPVRQFANIQATISNHDAQKAPSETQASDMAKSQNFGNDITYANCIERITLSDVRLREAWDCATSPIADPAEGHEP